MFVLLPYMAFIKALGITLLPETTANVGRGGRLGSKCLSSSKQHKAQAYHRMVDIDVYLYKYRAVIVPGE